MFSRALAKWLLPFVAFLLMGVSCFKEARETMRFPLSSFSVRQSECDDARLTGWFLEMKRVVCYPLDFEGRLLGLTGPNRANPLER